MAVTLHLQSLTPPCTRYKTKRRFGRGWKRVTDKVSDCIQGMPLGWLTAFMTAINTTWPHVDHLLINNGMSGGTWGALLEVRAVTSSDH